MNVILLALAAGGFFTFLACGAWALRLQDNIWLRHRTRAKRLFIVAFCFLIISLGLAFVGVIGLD